MCNKNSDHMMYSSWNIVCNRRRDRQTDGQMDGQMDGLTDKRKKWHIEVDIPPKKLTISLALKIHIFLFRISNNFPLFNLTEYKSKLNIYSTFNSWWCVLCKKKKISSRIEKNTILSCPKNNQGSISTTQAQSR